jgi:hypothetical protein
MAESRIYATKDLKAKNKNKIPFIDLRPWRFPQRVPTRALKAVLVSKFFLC